MPLQVGKTPIVVPRQHQFNEHVNDHQVEFARNVSKRMGTIIDVEDIETLGDIITNYDQIVAGMGHGMSSNNAKFNEELEKLVDKSAEKVITYAASCGSTKAENLSDELRETVKNAMLNLSAVSVRDENTAKFVQNVTGKDFVYNLDPVAVGDFDEEIRDVMVTPKLPERYCIVYSYSERFSEPNEIKAISEYCRAKGLKIVAPFGRQKWIPTYETLTPFELLKAFQNAECIVTDTFHGTLFGAKFGKKMAVW